MIPVLILGWFNLSTVEPKGVIVRLAVPWGFTDDVQNIIDAVGEHMSINEVIFEDAVNA